MKKKPLVSIMIPNRNHSKYLDKAIESALCQTYKNIEILVCDNCSDDASIEVAMKYVNNGVKIFKNPMNVMAFNYNILSSLVDGDYLVMLCADDIIKPCFVEKMVDLLEKNTNVGFIHCERDYIDTEGNVSELDPFFNCSFMAQGESMLPIFMMTDVAQAAQGMMRRSTFEQMGKHETESPHLNIDREQWFRLAMMSDYIYIREKLTQIRIHDNSAVSTSAKSFLHPVLLHHTIENFIRWAKIRGYENVLERAQASYSKLANDLLHFAIKFIKAEEYTLAKKYLLFMQVLDDNISTNHNYLLCIDMCNSKSKTSLDKLDGIVIDIYAKRKRNYAPPLGFEIII